MIIRPERAGDMDAITNIVRAAFLQEDEVQMVARLRLSGELIISLVAVTLSDRAAPVRGRIIEPTAFAELA